MTTPRVYRFSKKDKLHHETGFEHSEFILLSDHKEVVKALEDEQVLHIELLGKEYDKTINRQALAIDKLKEQVAALCRANHGVYSTKASRIIKQYEKEIDAILQEEK